MSTITATPAGQTLQQIADAANPGDVITVEPGQYAGFMMTRSGNAGAPIRFNALPGAQIVTPVPSKGDGIDLEGASYIHVMGFTCNGMARAGIRSVGVDAANRAQGVLIMNCRCDANAMWGIFTSYSDLVEIERNRCSNSLAEHGIYVSHATRAPRVIGNECFGNAMNGIHLNSGVNEFVEEAFVANNVVHDNSAKNGGSGINCDGIVNSAITNNMLYANHASGISLYRYTSSAPATGNIVQNNIVVMFGSDGLVVPGSQYALNIRNASTSNTIIGNVFTSMLLDADCLPGYFGENNTIVVPVGKPLYLSADSDKTHLTPTQWAATTGEIGMKVLTPDQAFKGWPGFYERAA